MVNYRINPIPREVDSGEIWGDQDLNFDSISDNGEIPLYMSINANEGYTVTASNFNIKGCSPTYTFIDTNGIEVREWNNGEQTTYTAPDGTTSTVTIGEGNFVMPNINKVQMYDSNASSPQVLWPTSGYTDSDLNNGEFVPQWGWAAGLQVGAVYNTMGGFSNVLLGGTSVQVGDVIGAFYEQDGNYTCAGIHQWNNDTLNNDSAIYMNIWGDQSYFNAVILGLLSDSNPGWGFSPGQEIHFFILQQSTGNTYRYANTQWNLTYGGDDPSGGWNDGDIYFPLAYGYQTLNDNANVSLYETSVVDDSNFVNVKAWVNYNYEIGIEDTQLYLDIDGDAQLIENTITAQQVKLTVVMKNENSNCAVHAYPAFSQGGDNTVIPFTTGTEDMPGASPYNITLNGGWMVPSDYPLYPVSEIYETGGNKASVLLETRQGNAINSPYYSGVGLPGQTWDGNEASLTDCVQFVITPATTNHALTVGNLVDDNETTTTTLGEGDFTAGSSAQGPQATGMWLSGLFNWGTPASSSGGGGVTKYSTLVDNVSTFKLIYNDDTEEVYNVSQDGCLDMENVFIDPNGSGQTFNTLDNSASSYVSSCNAVRLYNFNTVVGGNPNSTPWGYMWSALDPLGNNLTAADYFDISLTNWVHVDFHTVLNNLDISNIKEIIYEIGGEAMSVGSSMPTVPINGIISEDTD